MSISYLLGDIRDWLSGLDFGAVGICALAFDTFKPAVNSLSVITDVITAVIATVITPFGGSITCIIVQSFFSTDFLKISSFKLNGKYFIK